MPEVEFDSTNNNLNYNFLFLIIIVKRYFKALAFFESALVTRWAKDGVAQTYLGSVHSGIVSLDSFIDRC